jgi:hypothetical protein
MKSTPRTLMMKSTPPTMTIKGPPTTENPEVEKPVDLTQ